MIVYTNVENHLFSSLVINYVESPNSNLKLLYFYSYINAFKKFLKIDTVYSKSISCSSPYLCTVGA